jgi:hypothetical protein
LYLTIKRGENGFQIGLRAEQTISKGELLKSANKTIPKKLYHFPSTGLTYNPNQTMLW